MRFSQAQAAISTLLRTPSLAWMPDTWVLTVAQRDEEFRADLLVGTTPRDLPHHLNARYWRFQWLESAIYLGLAAGLAGLGLWRIQRRSVGRRG